MKAIILAAGLGTRLGDLTKELPKCLAEINQIPMLKRQIDCLMAVGIDDVYVVVGQNGPCWNKRYYDIIKGFCPNIIVNPKNLSTQNSYSLLVGLRSAGTCNEVMAIDGDLLFEKRIAMDIMNNLGDVTLLTRRAMYLQDSGTIVETKRNMQVVSIGREIKPAHFPWQIYGGMLRLNGKKIIRSFMSNMSDELVESMELGDIINRMLRGSSVYCLERNKGWININTASDILRAEKEYAEIS